MIEIGWFTAKLFFKGKLLRDPMYFVRQTSIGIGVSALILFLLAQTNLSLWVSISISSFATGLIMPYLLKDLKLK